MSYKIVATKEDATVRWARQSLLIAAAKARVWASEGWQVVVTDGDERILIPPISRSCSRHPSSALRVSQPTRPAAPDRGHG